MSRGAAGHFRRKREAPLILRGSTSQFRGHPRPSPHLGLCTFPEHLVVDLIATIELVLPALSRGSGAPTLLTRPSQERRWPRRPVGGYNTGGDRSP